jgi:hypothetical protein
MLVFRILFETNSTLGTKSKAIIIAKRSGWQFKHHRIYEGGF